MNEETNPQRQSLIDKLRKRLRAAGGARLPAIATETGLNYHMLRKLSAGDTSLNPPIKHMETLRDYFADIHMGRRKLPEKPPGARGRGRPPKRKGDASEPAALA